MIHKRVVFAALCFSPRNAFSLILPASSTSANSSSPLRIRKSSPRSMSSSSSSSSSLPPHDTTSGGDQQHYRKDGVRITHDPYAPGMAEHYGLPGLTDPDGFDPYADTVGAGIYGGSVQRDETTGDVVIGQQYQNHNHRPGPVYDEEKGYSFMSRAIQAGSETVQKILKDFPQLKEEVSTGGARPLHVCGMSSNGQQSTQVLIDAGADIYVQDTYGYTALHRMASNNLAVGGEALVRAGQDPNAPMEGADSTPIDIAKRSRAIQFLMKMQALGHYD
jgi:hypothetical protein